MKKRQIDEYPYIPFWLSTEKDSLFPNQDELIIKQLRLVKLKEVPYPEKFKKKLVRLFKIYGFKDPLNQMYVPMYLKSFGGKITEEKEYDYSKVDWDAFYCFMLAQMLLNFTDYGIGDNHEKILDVSTGILRDKVSGTHPQYLNDYSEWG